MITSRSVKTCASRTVSCSKPFSKQISARGRYAITDLVVDMDSPKYASVETIQTFVQELQPISFSYTNMRKLSIKAPYAIMDATIMKSIMNLEAPFDSVELEFFAFVGPQNDQWLRVKPLKEVSLTVNDGVGYKNSLNDALAGLCHHHPNLKTLKINNRTPHYVDVNRSLFPKKTVFLFC